MRVTKENTNLGGSKTLTGVLDDLLNDRVGSELQPAGGVARVGGSRRGHTLSFTVKTSHFDKMWCVLSNGEQCYRGFKERRRKVESLVSFDEKKILGGHKKKKVRFFQIGNHILGYNPKDYCLP